MTVVLDAAALLALLLSEKGSDVVAAVVRGGIMSAVNVSECCSRGLERGSTIEAVTRAVRRFEIVVVPLGLDLAVRAAELRPLTRHVGSSLGDRACLALAETRGLPIYTADTRMGRLQGQLGIDIRLIR